MVLELPEIIYRGVERPDLGDIRVFDAGGTMTPFIIRRPPAVNTPPAPRELPLFDPLTVPGPRRETSVEGQKSRDGRRITYDTGAYYPVTGIDFILPEPDSVPVIVKNRFSRDEEWRFQGEETIYRFHGASGEIRKNKVLEIASPAPYWELEARGEVPFGEIPRCVLIWEPYELIFLGRGTGPWTLAYGNREYGPPGEPSLNLDDAPVLIPSSPLGNGRYQARVSRDTGLKDHGPWLLWGVLFLAAAVLTILACSVGRTLGK
jgi:hypothetical protein